MHAITRSALWLSFFGLILVCWAVLYVMATGMGLDLMGRPVGPLLEICTTDGAVPGNDLYSAPLAGLPAAHSQHIAMMTQFLPLFGMWAAMMAAMMLPTMMPTLRAYDDLIRVANGSRAGWSGLVLGYLTVWLVFSAGASGLQLTLLELGVVDILGVTNSNWVAAGLLIAVGLYQFTPVKEACHGVCQSPTSYFIGNWRTGFDGGLRMGLGLGAFCVGCCWAIMALGFVGGVMSLLWMGLATLFMVIEKLPQIGRYVTRPAGAMLVLGGLIVGFKPLIEGG